MWLDAGSADGRVLFEAMAFFAAGIASLSIWAALSKRHWFVRAFVVAAAIAVLFPLRAFEPALLFMFGAPLIVVIIAIIRLRFGVAITNPSVNTAIGIRVMIFCYGTIALFLLMAIFWPMFGRPNPLKVSTIPSWYEWVAFGMLAIAPAAVVVMRFRTGQQTGLGEPNSPSPTKGFRFTLRDLLLSMVIVGISAAMVASIAGEPLIIDWLGMLGTGACLGIVGVTAACVVLVRKGWIIFAIGLMLAITSSAALHTWVLSDWTDATAIVWVSRRLPIVKVFLFAFLVLAMVVMIVTYLLLVAGALGEPAGRGTAWNPMSRAARIALLGVCLAVYGPIGVVYYRMLATAPMPNESLPDTNALPQLVGAVIQLEQLNPTNLTVAEIRSLMRNSIQAQQIAENYRVLMETLQQPIFIPMDLTGDARVRFIDTEMPVYQKFRRLAGTWDREGQDAAKAQQFDRAAEFGIANMGLGSKLQIGGVFQTSFLGAAIEEVGVEQIIQIRGDISLGESRQFLKIAEEILHARELPHVTIAREDAFNERAYSWRSRLGREAPVIFALAEPRKLLNAHAFEDTVNRRDARLRLLMVDFAIRLFKHDVGHLPESLAELHPRYLSAIPMDPYSGRPLVYRRVGDTYVLYSVGRDGKDDGGRFGTLTDSYSAGFDLDVDTGNRKTTAVPAPTNANE